MHWEDGCPNCKKELECIETGENYQRYVCGERCEGEDSFDAHFCKKCGELMEGEECVNICDECGSHLTHGKEQFCSEICNKAYHDAYKHHGEDAARIAYEESKYDNYYDFGHDEGDWEEE